VYSAIEAVLLWKEVHEGRKTLPAVFAFSTAVLSPSALPVILPRSRETKKRNHGMASKFAEFRALVYANEERTRLLGQAFIEQMGFN
jgi:hypothetical protein